ncbi:MAG: DUF1194 domain-containing protein [Hyphomicrobiaceae bacterium]
MAQKVGSTIKVDLALVLALDISASVDDREFNLQKLGLAAALTNPKVLDAIKFGSNKRIAVTVVQWAGYRQQFVSVPWQLIGDAENAQEFAADLSAMGRRETLGFTHIGGAIRFSAQLLEPMQLAADRRVVDISGDGTNNVSPRPQSARDNAVRSGITINGLAIANEVRDLNAYYRNTVIGGPGAFVIVAQDYSDYEKAMIQKLVREINAKAIF